ncbi:MAG TPA: hypothetical protein VEK13_00855 [Thermoplasmata archaeon]|nr:hypothetical protein [Thermoplasmata archaeon]
MRIPEGTGARIGKKVGAFVLYDLVTGLTAYCLIVLSGLWYFCVSWIHLRSEYSAVGLTFGSVGQLNLAWIGAFVALPLAAAVVYLAILAYRVPKDVARTGGRETLENLREHLTWFGRHRLRPH